MLLSECPEGLPYEVSFRGMVLYRYRKGAMVCHVDCRPLSSPVLLTYTTDHPPEAYTVIKPLFRQDGDD